MLGKLTADRGTLASVLATAKKAVAGSKNGVLIRSNGSNLMVRTATQGMTFTARVRDVDASDGFEAHLPLTIADILGAMPGNQVTIELTESEALISAGGAELGLRTLSVNDFPRGKAIPEDLFELPRAALVGLLDTVRFAASDEVSRANLCGVHFALVNGTLTVTATDSYRAAIAEMATDVHTNVTATIPSAAVAAIVGMLTGDTVKIGIVETSHVYATDGIVSVIADALVGAYPVVGNLVPKTSNVQVTVDVASLTAALRLVRLAAANGDEAVVLECSSDGVVLRPKNIAEDTSRAATVPVDGRVVAGDDITFGINPSYLQQAAGAVGGATITVELVDPVKPLIVAGAAGNVTQVVMPVRVA